MDGAAEVSEPVAGCEAAVESSIAAGTSTLLRFGARRLGRLQKRPARGSLARARSTNGLSRRWGEGEGVANEYPACGYLSCEARDPNVKLTGGDSCGRGRRLNWVVEARELLPWEGDEKNRGLARRADSRDWVEGPAERISLRGRPVCGVEAPNVLEMDSEEGVNWADTPMEELASVELGWETIVA